MIEHQSLGAVNLGYHSGPAGDDAARQALVEEGAGLFRAAGLDSTGMPDLEQARWQKLVWNVPYNGLSVLLDAGTTALMRNADSRELIQAIMQEVVEGALACGHSLPEGFAGKLLAATDRMPDYLPSMYHDFAQRRPLELEAIYAAPWQRPLRRAGTCRASARCTRPCASSTRATRNKETGMAGGLADKLVLAISSRALFDLNESHRVYESEGIEAYRQYQIDHEDEVLDPGDAFPWCRSSSASTAHWASHASR